ncbi:MAG: PIN domain-containing protein [Treponema sp.]|jgi:predicted nucleic acid-binding protein|nr:PIN domain-containing protein [Treponema sp.]
MTLSYFDSSPPLAIILDEDRKQEAYEYWHNAEIRCSSILLKIETTVVLRRFFEHNKDRLDGNWLNEKTKILQEYLNEVNYYVINDEIEREIFLRKELSYCRALDAIHVATALKFKELDGVTDVLFYTFDNRMKTLSESFKFKTNKKIKES